MPRPLTSAEYEQMMSEFDEAGEWMSDQMKVIHRPHALRLRGSDTGVALHSEACDQGLPARGAVKTGMESRSCFIGRSTLTTVHETRCWHVGPFILDAPQDGF